MKVGAHDSSPERVQENDYCLRVVTKLLKAIDPTDIISDIEHERTSLTSHWNIELEFETPPLDEIMIRFQLFWPMRARQSLEIRTNRFNREEKEVASRDTSVGRIFQQKELDADIALSYRA